MDTFPHKSCLQFSAVLKTMPRRSGSHWGCVGSEQWSWHGVADAKRAAVYVFSTDRSCFYLNVSRSGRFIDEWINEWKLLPIWDTIILSEYDLIDFCSFSQNLLQSTPIRRRIRSSVFSSNGWANSITGQNLSVCVSVCVRVLTRLASKRCCPQAN